MWWRGDVIPAGLAARGDDAIVVISGSLLLGLGSGTAPCLSTSFRSPTSGDHDSERDASAGKESSSIGKAGEEERVLNAKAWKSNLRRTSSGVGDRSWPRATGDELALNGDFTELFFLWDGLSNVSSFGGVMSEVTFSLCVECVCF